ncbi:MAG: hypothetical protein ACLP9S_04650 [Syntrophales bacterium]
MNTEIMNTLELVRNAEKLVDKARQNPDLTDNQRNILNTLYALLLDIDDRLVLEDITSSLERLQDDSNNLQTISDQIKVEISNLQNVAAVVDKVANAVGTLADIFAKAASAGIV